MWIQLAETPFAAATPWAFHRFRVPLSYTWLPRNDRRQILCRLLYSKLLSRAFPFFSRALPLPPRNRGTTCVRMPRRVASHLWLHLPSSAPALARSHRAHPVDLALAPTLQLCRRGTPPSACIVIGGLNASIVAVCFTPGTLSAALSSTDFTLLPKTGGCATLAYNIPSMCVSWP